MNILIGMFDSPFVRRVAVSMKLLDMPFEHRNWSVGKDQADIRRYNPLGRVPTLVLGDGETLIESSSILDFLDETVGAERALLPRSGAERRLALKLMAIASGIADKGVSQLYEGAFRPAEKRHEPWVERCRSQMDEGLAELDRYATTLDGNGWLIGTRMTQADITVACATTFVHEALSLDATRYPSLMRQVARCEELPVFREIHLPFFTPQS
ncbi:glutathione S-transferase family protein [Stenotrophobium rhamnosiphilum]|uniref:Glutathione S-transferase family protein n=1 Tax=Stenotrophobium rhamnosiphilum TaxID=2029166 RepID=A0A2T5MBG0_9GAMM|nr:glutathione S-transferase family protein [Stenotrophobium rhamnosiphilum]PTU29057.1 glutathione S-transferase family protein [Stenotrophobium rhamnosiphilum]